MKLSRENEIFMKNLKGIKNIFGPIVFVIERTPVAKDLYVYSSNHVHSESFHQLGSLLSYTMIQFLHKYDSKGQFFVALTHDAIA